MAACAGEHRRPAASVPDAGRVRDSLSIASRAYVATASRRRAGARASAEVGLHMGTICQNIANAPGPPPPIPNPVTDLSWPAFCSETRPRALRRGNVKLAVPRRAYIYVSSFPSDGIH